MQQGYTVFCIVMRHYIGLFEISTRTFRANQLIVYEPVSFVNVMEEKVCWPFGFGYSSNMEATMICHVNDEPRLVIFSFFYFTCSLSVEPAIYCFCFYSYVPLRTRWKSRWWIACADIISGNHRRRRRRQLALELFNNVTRLWIFYTPISRS